MILYLPKPTTSLNKPLKVGPMGSQLTNILAYVQNLTAKGLCMEDDMYSNK